MYKVNVVNKHKYLGGSITSYFISRGSIFGNPFTHLELEKTKAEFQVESREVAIEKYKKYFLEKLKNDEEFKFRFMVMVKTLVAEKEINLICYCAPKACHGDFISKILIKSAEQYKNKKS